jgi:acetoin utilization protein AcuB
MLSAQDIVLEHDIYTVDNQDTVGDALRIINNLQLRQLLIVENGMFYGVLSEEYLLEYQPDQLIHEIKDVRRDIFVSPSSNFLDVFYKMVKDRLSLCPVVDNGNVLGIVLFTDLSDTLIEYLHLDTMGKLIVAEQLRADYSMAGICRIFESEGHKVLMAFAREVPETGNYMVAVKTNSHIESSLLNTFERYGIKIIANYSEEGFDTVWKDRYESLMTYLNV